jgi:hypothetical protein
VSEREPAPRRIGNYKGDHRHVLDQGYAALMGPDMRGIAWLPCHVDYDADIDRSRVIYRPVAEYELKKAMQSHEGETSQ